MIRLRHQLPVLSQAALLLVLLWATFCAQAARVVEIPVFRGPTGLPAPTKVKFTLVDAVGRPLLGLTSPSGEPILGSYEVTSGTEAQDVSLAVQTDIAPASWWQIDVTGAVNARYKVQIAASADPLLWADLIQAGAPLSPADLSALTRHVDDVAVQKHLPSMDGVPDGQILTTEGEAAVWAPGVVSETDPLFQASPAAGIGAQDITDWGAAYGWGDHGLMGYLLPGDDAATLGSDTATAGYAPLADGAGGIAWGPIAVSAETYAPTVLTVTYGTLTSGTVADLAEKDGTSVAIAEASGAGTALQLTLDFAGVTSFHSLAIFGQYDGSDSHQIAVEVWDYDASAWEVYGYLPNTDDPQWHFYTIADPEEHVSAGAAQVRLRHIQTGNTTHDLYLDQVYLSGAVAGGAIAHQDIVGRSVADQHPASAITNTPAGTLAATTVQGALDELDTEKLPAGADAADLTSGTATDGYALTADGAGGAAWEATDHGALTGLGDDDHAQYPLLAGRSGGQTIKGGTGVTDALTLTGTAGNGTSTSAAIALTVGNNGATTAATVLNNGRIGLNTTPEQPLHVVGKGSGQGAIRIDNSSAGASLVAYRPDLSMAGAMQVGGSNKANFIFSNNTSFSIATDTLAAVLSGTLNSPPSLFQVDSSGYVGIGVTAGRERLEVSGNIQAINGIVATSLRAHNTFTDLSNYERAVVGWTTASNVLTIGAQAAGTGTVRPVSFVGASFTFAADAIRITTNRTPSASTDACVAGELFSDDAYIYKCVASGNIKRTAIATW